jgi:membrane protein CcdC involved in cytochrome C biogenesis
MGIYSYSTARPPAGKQIMMPVIIISTGTISFIYKTPLNKGFGCILIFHGVFVNQNYS